MLPLDTAATAISPVSHHESSTIAVAAAAICLVWYIAVALVCTIGYVQIFRWYSTPHESGSPNDMAAGPHITIIRPVSGLEPSLYECLASTFHQDYPPWKLHIRFCISSRRDPALPILERLLADFPDFDAKILVEEEDSMLLDGSIKLGPNPKIRNMSRAYREGIRRSGDIVWIVDCNVWVGPTTCDRMLTALGGHKFAHQLPLVVDTLGTTSLEETKGLSNKNGNIGQIRTESSAGHDSQLLRTNERSFWNIGGGRLEEVFMSSAHAKFYTAINTVLLAPCVVGKSTMFSMSDLDSLTNGRGIDYFSSNICEDHLIGDMLWKHKVPEELRGKKLGKHALCFGDLAIQPMSSMSIGEYWNRRVRWLRVRKFTVTLATLVEPGTESFLCSLYLAYAVTTLQFFNNYLSIPRSWSAFAFTWLLSVSIWCAMDWQLYRKLHSGASIWIEEHTPGFARPPKRGSRRPFHEWLVAWIGRESLALPIWLWAFYGGTQVEWRGRKFWVGVDMRVHEITEERKAR